MPTKGKSISRDSCIRQSGAWADSSQWPLKTRLGSARPARSFLAIGSRLGAARRAARRRGAAAGGAALDTTLTRARTRARSRRARRKSRVERGRRRESGRGTEWYVPRPNELQPTSGILLKMRGRGLPEGWPRPSKVAPFFERLARPALPSNLATPSRAGRPASLPESHTAADRSLLLSRRPREPSEPRGWSSRLPSPYPRHRSPNTGARSSDTKAHTHVRAVADPHAGAKRAPRSPGRTKAFLFYEDSRIVRDNDISLSHDCYHDNCMFL